MIGVYVLTFSFIFFRSIIVYLKSGSQLTFFVIFLYFLQKYRCVPKIGFSADIFIDIYIDIIIDISIDIFTDISIDIFIDIFVDISIDIFIDILTDIFIDIFIGIYIEIVTDKEEGRRGKEGVDFFLKFSNPTPTGGEQTNI